MNNNSNECTKNIIYIYTNFVLNFEAVLLFEQTITEFTEKIARLKIFKFRPKFRAKYTNPTDSYVLRFDILSGYKSSTLVDIPTIWIMI